MEPSHFRSFAFLPIYMKFDDDSCDAKKIPESGNRHPLLYSLQFEEQAQGLLVMDDCKGINLG